MTSDTPDAPILDAIMSAAVDAIVVSDAKGEILRANPAAERLFGYDAGTLLGQSVNAIMPDGIAALHNGYMNDYARTGSSTILGHSRDVTGQRRNHERFPLQLAVGEAEIDGETRFVAIMHDLTRRAASDAAVARSQRLDAIGQMTGGITHDFNNLLTVIIGNLELLEPRLKDDARAHSLLQSAIDSAELASDLTSRLMLFARKGQLNPEAIDLTEVCQNLLGVLRRTLGPGIRISSAFDKGPARVSIDRVQVQSAILNLALNARDAMPDGGEILFSVGHVVIDDDYMAQETDVAPGHYIRLSVSDTGAGMMPEVRDKAFEPFFTTKPETHGTGLGLASVYGFVRQSGGHITLYSEPGVGTSFGLYFPALDAPARETETETADIANTADGGEGQLILVVEDNARVRRITVERLEALGYQTVVAETGDDAWRMLEAGVTPALVFSDLVMPGALNGYGLAARISERFPDLKVLLTSGYASDVVTGQLATGEPREVLHKPYHQRELAARLQALLGDA